VGEPDSKTLKYFMLEGFLMAVVFAKKTAPSGTVFKFLFYTTYRSGR